MTRDLQERLEAQWPELATRLRRYLLRTGVRAGRVDDVVQETAARLVSMWEQVDPSRPTWPLVKTIASNLLRDEARRRFEEVPSELPDLPLPHDHEGSLMAHLDLSRVRTALQEMSPAYRAVLLVEAGVPSHLPVAGTNAEKMMRMRARRRLKELVRKLPALLPARMKLLEAGQIMTGLRDLAVPGIACLACVSLYPSMMVPPTGMAGQVAADALPTTDGVSAPAYAVTLIGSGAADLADELASLRASHGSTAKGTNATSQPSSDAVDGGSSLPEVPETPDVPGYEGVPVADHADNAVEKPDPGPELPTLPLPETGLDLGLGL